MSKQRFFQRIHGWQRRDKALLAGSVDLISVPVALYAALGLRLGQWLPDAAPFWPAFLVAMVVSIPIFAGFGLYRHMIRHIGGHAFTSVAQGAGIIAIAVTAVAYMVPLAGFPRSVPVIFWFLLLSFVIGSRYLARTILLWDLRNERPQNPILIFGAGEKGLELARILRQQGEYAPTAFLDNNVGLQHRSMDGLYIYPPDQIARVLRRTGAQEVFVAVASTGNGDRRQIIEFLEPYSVRVRLIPDLAEIATGRQSLANVRDVEVDDILGRDAVEPLPHLLSDSVQGRRVLVTGAGGSIGSELARQILRQEPESLVLLDQSEYGLYEIQRELKALAAVEGLKLPITPVLGSVVSQPFILRTFEQYGIETVYHAAAYKHVELVERNAIQGLKNNTFGTLHTAQAAMDAGVNDFILISTDKAVRTTNVMGASKRLAEMVLQALQVNSDHTRFSMVRFGNVLGSSGSVVPLFMEQIEQGGPVTVTHKDVTRYFMTIPEAAQLVLQAASMAEGGDVFLLDMGKPVKILDLAKRLIRLKGYSILDEDTPDGDIEIQITGLKPGEKLHEELLVGDAVAGTDHRKIMRAEEGFVPWTELRGALNTLEQACDDYDYEAIKSFIEGLVEGSDIRVQLGDLRALAEVVDFKPVYPA
ncbi:MAG: nucleoside-diphosphate sugar epimerase/dehydratase [Pseudomonadota bacterium]